ncbi:hypothetical protein QVD17_02582 [Tagetes erecta]|uniref:Reverse transcriptase zinc-binding domain-containing protein n=1 Tax=Tagetes erecta TaxID=13708 RepID=A0AAD8L6V9_TARER|nr:hypothetical protein QVD17_02582 [Tagetes erecta]
MGAAPNSWFNDPGFFDTKDARTIIESLILPAYDSDFVWSSWVPVKVNVFGWRSSLDRIPCKLGLAKRNIIPDPFCQSCNSMEEDANHILLNCQFARRIWSALSIWCKLPVFAATNVSDLLKVPNLWPLSPEKKKVIYAIFLSTLWCLWKAWNDRNFNNLFKTDRDILGDIKSLSFLWIKTRAKMINLKWRQWCNFLF